MYKLMETLVKFTNFLRLFPSKHISMKRLRKIECRVSCMSRNMTFYKGDISFSSVRDISFTLFNATEGEGFRMERRGEGTKEEGGRGGARGTGISLTPLKPKCSP